MMLLLVGRAPEYSPTALRRRSECPVPERFLDERDHLLVHRNPQSGTDGNGNGMTPPYSSPV